MECRQVKPEENNMPFTKTYEVPSTGATASYHEASHVSLDRQGQFAVVTVASYVSAEAKTAGKMAMFSQQIRVMGLPDAADAFGWAEQHLVIEAPSPAPVDTPVNRYVFAGGVQ
jgi:hypothetical protein